MNLKHVNGWIAALAALAGLGAASARAADVGVSIEISQPGVYGRVDIGRYPRPAVILPQPVIVQPAPVVVAPQPVYLWVPPAHRRNWRRHCAQYRACGAPVYFVRDGWYHEHVDRGHGRGHKHRN